MTPRLSVRLGTRGRIDCGAPTCAQPRLPGVLRVREPDEPARLLLADGWKVGDDGIWRLTRRALASKAFMSGAVDDTRRGDMRDWDASSKATSVQGRVPFGSITLVCPACNAPQRVVPEEIGVQELQHREHPGRDTCGYCSQGIDVAGKPDAWRTVYPLSWVG